MITKAKIFALFVLYSKHNHVLPKWLIYLETQYLANKNDNNDKEYILRDMFQALF